jgi:hypothetical protein
MGGSTGIGRRYRPPREAGNCYLCQALRSAFDRIVAIRAATVVGIALAAHKPGTGRRDMLQQPANARISNAAVNGTLALRMRQCITDLLPLGHVAGAYPRTRQWIAVAERE